jgi:hypothetical protein
MFSITKDYSTLNFSRDFVRAYTYDFDEDGDVYYLVIYLFDGDFIEVDDLDTIYDFLDFMGF